MRKIYFLKLQLAILLISLSLSPPLFAQESNLEGSLDYIFDLTLEELLNTKTSIASFQSTSIREQPGIISIITRSDIEQNGARDLIDIINLVPGFSFAGTAIEVVGLSSRGIWVHEGKVLVQIDGQRINETRFGNIPLNNRISADLIEKIEIIRGPGSAVYGGVAELAVINIVTRGAEFDGFWVSSDVSYNRGHYNAKQDLVFNGEYDDLTLSVAASTKQGTKSNEIITDISGNQSDMSEDSTIHDTYYFNVGLELNGFKFRYIEDSYKNEYRDNFGISDTLYTVDFDAKLASIKYTYALNDKITIIPEIKYAEHHSWQRQAKGGGIPLEDSIATRTTYNLTNLYNIDKNKLLSFGFEYYEDEGKARDEQGFPKEIHFFGNSDHITFYNRAMFSDLGLITDIGNFSVGGRYEKHNFAGSAAVPRVSYTKVWKKFHTKILFSKAFRTPDVENSNFVFGNTEPAKSETSTAYEAEIGYQFNNETLWHTNFYQIEVEDPIFFGDRTVASDSLSTYGLESELRYKPNWGDLKFSYSYYYAKETGINVWKSDENDKNVGAPNHKFTYDLTYKFSDTNSLNLNGFYVSTIRSYNYKDNQNQLDNYESQIITNLYFLNKRKQLSIGVGISDLFNEKQRYAPAYNSNSGAIPAMSRELYIKVSFEF